MRADTHDGPEQMLHVRGLIHCCNSHVRRSWNSVLQRTAGPYIMARNRLGAMSALPAAIRGKRTHCGHVATAVFNPLRNPLLIFLAMDYAAVHERGSRWASSSSMNSWI